MLAGTCDANGFVERCVVVLGRRHRWLAPLCRRAFQHFGAALGERDRPRLIEWICGDEGYLEAWQAARPPRIAQYVLEPARMSPRAGVLATCDLPDLPTLGDLAAWLGVTTRELAWFADVRGMNAPEGALCHYLYRWIAKRHGVRLLEAPKPRLRAIQRRILRGILDLVPVHRAAHGFRRGKSCRSHAEPHVGRDVVLRMDLRSFFASIPAARVHALFATLGYPASVARALAALCTNQVPRTMVPAGVMSWDEARCLGVPHLPQGAPTSPALANLCAFRLDLRLEALASAMGGQFTRYADDIAMSGGESLRRDIAGITTLVARIAIEEGFEVNHRKTRRMFRSHRQVLTGIVVNRKPNVRRQDFDRLKAVLTNCVRHGPASQDRDGTRDFKAHLAGRVAHVASLNAARGARLEAIFGRIDWER